MFQRNFYGRQLSLGGGGKICNLINAVVVSAAVASSSLLFLRLHAAPDFPPCCSTDPSV